MWCENGSLRLLVRQCDYIHFFYEKQREHTQRWKSTCLRRQVAIKLIIGTPLIWSRVFFFLYTRCCFNLYTRKPLKNVPGCSSHDGEKHGLVIILLRCYFPDFIFSRLSFRNNGLEIYSSLFWRCFFFCLFFTEGDKSTKTSKCCDIKNDDGKRLLLT